MNEAPLHCVRSTAWAFTAVLASTSALGAEAAAPWLTLEQQLSYPCLAWPNVPGRTYSIQSRERVAGGDWASVVTLTTDAKAGTWTDETQPGATRFYRVGALADTNWASRLQAALNSARTSYGAKGAAAVVITTDGLRQDTSGLSEPRTTNSVQPQMRTRFLEPLQLRRMPCTGSRPWPLRLYRNSSLCWISRSGRVVG